MFQMHYVVEAIYPWLVRAVKHATHVLRGSVFLRDKPGVQYPGRRGVPGRTRLHRMGEQRRVDQRIALALIVVGGLLTPFTPFIGVIVIAAGAVLLAMHGDY